MTRSLGVSWLSLVLALVPAAASAIEFELDDIDFNLDSTISLGAARRLKNQDRSLIAFSNGGTARTANEDDGDFNYKKGAWFSEAAKITSDLAAKYGDFGIFARASYSHDFAAARAKFLGPQAHARLDNYFQLLDAMAYTTVNLGGIATNLRFGRQVVSWGESTFIGNSINAINPIDLAKLRTPGSEIKEALLPIPMFVASASLTDNLAVDAISILGYQSFRIDPRGTYFSTTDLISDDGDLAYAGFGRRNDQHHTSPDNDPSDPTGNTETAPHAVSRVADQKPAHVRNQYGIAFRYLAGWLNDTELGFFYLKYHSRVPLVSALRDSDPNSNCGPPTNTCTSPITDLLNDQSTVHYFAEFPEGIKLFGVSFNTNVPLGIAVQGEYSYRPNLPVQLSATELLLAGLRQNNANDRAAGVDPQTAPVYAQGYRRLKVQQFQTTLTKAFGPTFGADQFILLGEAGVTSIDLPAGFLFNGPGTQLPDCGDGTVVIALANGSCQEGRGYTTRLSYAYRALSRMDFENALFGAELSPRVIFTHDVRGVNPVSGFNQGTKVLIFGGAMSYLQRYTFDLSYTHFFGGRTYRGTDPGPPPVAARAPDGSVQSSDYTISANPVRDRDFAAVSLSYSF